MDQREIIKKRIKEDGGEYILVQFIDINGSPKEKMVLANHVDDVIEDGAGFAGAALMGLGQGPHSHDMLAKVDLDTYTLVPWEKGLARFSGDLFVDEEPYMFDPRQHLKNTLNQLRDDGLEFYVGIEPEHFLVEKTFPLNLLFCSNCLIVQIKKIIDRKEMFENYYYLSSVNQGLVSHFENLAKKRSEEHTSELQSLVNLVCRLLLEKKK